jgi:hypothetical protein
MGVHASPFKPFARTADPRPMARLRRQGARATVACLLVCAGAASCHQSQDVAADRGRDATAGQTLDRAPNPSSSAQVRTVTPPIGSAALRDLPPDEEPRTGDGSLDDHRRRLRIPTEASARAWLERFGDVVEEPQKSLR